MEYLYFLQTLRDAAPTWLNEAILFLSEFIGGAGGLAVMALIYWCISKRLGMFLMMNFSLAYVCNTVIKNIFCVPRPFNRDARLIPYAPVTGYSFPSGHTMLATGFYGGIAAAQRKRKWLVIVCILLTLLTAFGRNWIGAHTLEDVLVGMLCSCAVIALNGFLLRWVEEKAGRDGVLFAVSVVVFAVFCLLYPTSLKVAGIYGGVMFGWFVERRWVRFAIRGGIRFRILTFTTGILIVAALYKVLLPKLFAPLGNNWTGMLNYLLTFLVITAGWPAAIKALGARMEQKAAAKQTGAGNNKSV